MSTDEFSVPQSLISRAECEALLGYKPGQFTVAVNIYGGGMAAGAIVHRYLLLDKNEEVEELERLYARE